MGFLSRSEGQHRVSVCWKIFPASGPVADKKHLPIAVLVLGVVSVSWGTWLNIGKAWEST